MKKCSKTGCNAMNSVNKRFPLKLKAEYIKFEVKMEYCKTIRSSYDYTMVQSK